MNRQKRRGDVVGREGSTVEKGSGKRNLDVRQLRKYDITRSMHRRREINVVFLESMDFWDNELMLA